MKRNFYLNIMTASALFVFGAACAKKNIAVNAPATQAPVATATATPSAPPARTTTPEAPRQTQPVAQTAAPARYPDAATRARIDELLGRIQDAYFDYDRHTLTDAAVRTLSGDSKELAVILNQYPDYKIRVEGYCDERGSAEYNLALGEARARAAKDYLVTVGVASDQLSTVSYGKEKQICDEHDESCWSKNRRVHIIAMK